MSERRYRRFVGRSAPLVLVLACGAGQGVPAPDSETAPPPSSAPVASRSLALRQEQLQALDPARPGDYFELAEEVADAATTPEERELARMLYGLAGVLDRDRYARSSALGLATLSDDPRGERRLRALASLLERRTDGDTTVSDIAPRPSATAAIALSEAFSHFRRGQGPRALGMIKAAETAAILEHYGAGLPGGADRFREDCRAFKAGVRPELAPAHRHAMLSIEEAVLASAGERRERGFGSVLVETAGRPLLEVDAARLDEAFGVDPNRPWWRDGRWTDRP